MSNKIFFQQLQLGAMDNFGYIFADAESKEALLVDPSFDYEAIMSCIKENEFNLKAIVLTHHHFDHINEAFRIKEMTNARVYAHPMTAQLIKVKNLCDESINEGDLIELGQMTARCIHTPGHTPGGICLIVNDTYLVTGDTLFVGNCGRIDLLESNPKDMFASLQKLKALPDELIVCPGHDYGASKTNRLGDEKKTNPTMQVSSPAEWHC